MKKTDFPILLHKESSAIIERSRQLGRNNDLIKFMGENCTSTASSTDESETLTLGKLEEVKKLMQDDKVTLEHQRLSNFPCTTLIKMPPIIA